MSIGTQYIAPGGWSAMAPGVRHHRLATSSDGQRTLFAVFELKPPRSSIVVVQRHDFEDGLLNGAVVVAEQQIGEAPWLAEVKGTNFALLDHQQRRATKKNARTHESLVSQRASLISDAVAHSKSILSADNPERAANAFARRANPPQNETRFRNWLWTYLAFGEDMWSLMPPIHHNGTWVREDRPSKKKKLGRPSKYFSHRPWHSKSKAMTKECIKGYRYYSGLGIPMTKVYSQSMLKIFMCEPCKDSLGKPYWRQPEGKPFPTQWQFVYACKKRFTQKAMQETLLGAVQVRSKKAAVEGRFSQGCANLTEKTSTDASWTKEIPRGFNGKHQMPKICVVKIVCQVSGAIIGIGFSLKSESSRAYRMALFCCAIDKARWGRIFGVVVTAHQIPGMGLPSMIASDRGPFTAQEIYSLLEETRTGREMSPTHTPQSNASVESKHPRQPEPPGGPTYVLSSMTSIQLARYTINECIETNLTSSAVDRLTPEMVQEFGSATPMDIWNYLDSRHRNDSKAIPFESAVRLLLTRVKFRSRDGRLWLGEICFNSRDLMSTNLPPKLRKRDGIEIDGYVVDLAIRYAWIEVAGQLVEVEAQLPIRDDEEMLYCSINDVGMHAEKMREFRAGSIDAKPSVQASMRQKKEKEIGAEALSKVRKAGRAKTKTPASDDERRRTDRSKV